ncbi:MAG TPA: HAD family phosphatase [Verrucomicrobiae bacterium]|jgi:HAD superfamily hydrolase (TIGR01509 family)|nr:HAD family phosphatase [Verrucomicrobiae bacterium]
MKIPKVVVFDLGKVLVDFDYGISSAKFATKSRCNAGQIRELIDHAPLLYRFETGLLTNEQFYGEVCSTCGFSGSFVEFYEIFADIFTEIHPMTAMHAALRAHAVPTYIFSNTNGIAVAHIQKKFPFFANFDGYVYSFQQGVMKPDAKIYEVVENLTGHRGNDIVYLDDRFENFDAGRIRGWRAFLHKSPDETIPVLREWGLPIDA